MLLVIGKMLLLLGLWKGSLQRLHVPGGCIPRLLLVNFWQ